MVTVTSVNGTGELTLEYPHMAAARDAMRRDAILALELFNSRGDDKGYSLHETDSRNGYVVRKTTYRAVGRGIACYITSLG